MVKWLIKNILWKNCTTRIQKPAEEQQYWLLSDSFTVKLNNLYIVGDAGY